MRAWPATPNEIRGPLACLRAGGVGEIREETRRVRACANRRVAYVSTGDTKAVESPGELPAVGLDFPIGASSKSRQAGASGPRSGMGLVGQERRGDALGGGSTCARPSTRFARSTEGERRPLGEMLLECGEGVRYVPGRPSTTPGAPTSAANRRATRETPA